MIASSALLSEVQDVLERPKFRRWVTIDTAHEFIDGLREDADVVEDPPLLTGVTPDPDDDYLVALARAAHTDCLVSGDGHLLGLIDPVPPVLTPRQFLDLLEA